MSCALAGISPFTTWILPGHGESYESCGTVGWKVCYNLDEHPNREPYVKAYRHCCSRAECPVDYESWAALEAHRAMRRFEAASIRKPIHVVASPPHEIHTESVQVLRKRAYQLLKRVGVKGGVCIFHPFRWRCIMCGRDDESCRCQYVSETKRGEWYFSPHFHVLCYGWIEGTAEEYKRSGWVVKNLGVRKDTYRTLQYQLSHAGVWMKGREEGKGVTGILPLAKGKVLSITWFGTLSYSKLHVEEEDYRETCPLCGRPFKLLEWIGVGDPPPPSITFLLATGEVTEVSEGQVPSSVLRSFVDRNHLGVQEEYTPMVRVEIAEPKIERVRPPGANEEKGLGLFESIRKIERGGRQVPGRGGRQVLRTRTSKGREVIV